jgi:hypothetical protein
MAHSDLVIKEQKQNSNVSLEVKQQLTQATSPAPIEERVQLAPCLNVSVSDVPPTLVKRDNEASAHSNMDVLE